MAKKEKVRYDIRLSDIPEKLFKKIVENSNKNMRSQKDEVIFHLTKTYK